jgi:hypothetical protein
VTTHALVCVLGVLVLMNLLLTFFLFDELPDSSGDEFERLRYETARADAEMARVTKETIQAMLDEALDDDRRHSIEGP